MPGYIAWLRKRTGMKDEFLATVSHELRNAAQCSAWLGENAAKRHA